MLQLNAAMTVNVERKLSFDCSCIEDYFVAVQIDRSVMQSDISKVTTIRSHKVTRARSVSFSSSIGAVKGKSLNSPLLY